MVTPAVALYKCWNLCSAHIKKTMISGGVGLYVVKPLSLSYPDVVVVRFDSLNKLLTRFHKICIEIGLTGVQHR